MALHPGDSADSYERLNRIVRVVLLVSAAASLALFVAASRPTPRYRGVKLGALGAAEPILNDWDQTIVTVTVTNPSVVVFPHDLNIPDHVCVTVRWVRGNAPTTLPFDEALPQSLWDDRRDYQSLIIMPRDVETRTPDGTTSLIMSSANIAAVSTALPYQILWFGLQSIILDDNQAADRLVCYRFLSDNKPTVPADHVVRFRVENSPILQAPGYLFQLEPTAGNGIMLPRQDFESYLTGLLLDGSLVVRPEK